MDTHNNPPSRLSPPPLPPPSFSLFPFLSLLFHSLFFITLTTRVAHGYLELNNSVLRQTEVHAVGILEIEGTFVELGHRFISLQQYHLFVYFTDYLQVHNNHTD